MENEKINILLIDDDAQKLRTIENILDDQSLNLIACRSGDEGLRQLLKKEVAVILLDVNMPDMNGFETARMIRNRPRTEYTPIIFMTAYQYTDIDVAEGYGHGAVDFIFSPIKPKILRAKIRAFVDLYKKTRQIEQQKKELESLRDHLEEKVEERTSALNAEIVVRREAENTIKESLKEKEVLLAEVHHRVKNNLAVVSALLGLEMNNLKEKKIRQILLNSMSRIESMAIIHEKLYQAESFTHLPFRDYIEDLVGNITLSYQNDYQEVAVKIDIDGVLININQAIPCALMINELLSNAYKHAFKDKARGNIWITVSENSSNIIITVKDDGVGLPECFDLGQAKTMGMNLVNTWAKQLQAELTVSLGDGTCFVVDFPKSDRFGSNNSLSEEQYAALHPPAVPTPT
ncbi:MAG: histidine kinase dimerization/phosphoacceptor domain -containing protein [Balneolales bacterium]